MKKFLGLMSTAVMLIVLGILLSFNTFAAGTSFADATSVSVNSSRSDSISNQYSINYYKFKLSSPGSVYFNFKHENLLDQNEYWTITLYDGNTNEIAYYSFNGTDTDVNSKTVGLPSGTYYIRITGGDWYSSVSHRYSTVKYTFNVKYSDTSYWEKENNEAYSTASKISVNNNFSGTVNDKYDVDYYKFTLSSPGSIYFNFKHENLFDQNEYWTITLYDGNSNEIAYYTFNGTDTDVNSKTVGLPSGTYYIRITGGDWYSSVGHRYSTVKYTFNAKYSETTYWEKENNEIMSAGNSISMERKYYGSINDERDVDYYILTLKQDVDIKVTMDIVTQGTEYEYYTLVIFNDKTNELSYMSVPGNQKSTSSNVNLPAGTYYIRITGGDWYYSVSHRYSTATYSFKISEVISDVENIRASQTTSSITLKWDKVLNATGYIVYKYNPSNKKYVKLGSTEANSYKISGLSAGTTCKFKIKAYKKKSGGTIYSENAEVFSTATKPGKTSLTSTKATDSKIVVNWKKASGASGYQVVYSTSSKFKNKTSIYVKGATSLKKTLKELESGKTYYVKVRAYKSVSGSKVYGAYSDAKKITTKPAQVKYVYVTSVTTNKIVLTWEKTEGASGYQVVYSTSEKFKNSNSINVKGADSLKKTIKNVSSGTTYYVRIRAYKTVGESKIYGSYSDTQVFSTKPLTPVIKSLTSKSGKITVNWTTVKNAEGYLIEYSTNPNFSTSSGYTGHNYVYGGSVNKMVLDNYYYVGEKYYIRIRAYSDADGHSSTWGEPSDVKTVVIK